MHMAQRVCFQALVFFARFCVTSLLLAVLLTSAAAAELRPHELLNPQGQVEVLRKGANVWIPARTNIAIFPGDAVRTGVDSRAAIRLSNDSVIRLDQLTVMPFTESTTPRKRFLIKLLKGA